MQRRLWRVCTFAQVHLSIRPGTEISCAGSNNDLCTVYRTSECCGEAAPSTMAHLGNHQCVVSMRQKCLKGDCTGSSESTLVKILPHCWKSHVKAKCIFHWPFYTFFKLIRGEDPNTTKSEPSWAGQRNAI